MLGTTDEIRHALASAGWIVSWLTENALRDPERVYDVTNVGARREGLRASVVVLRDCRRGSFADRYDALPPSQTRAVRRAGDLKLFVDVRDFERARAEAESLFPA